ncbi:MAG: CapA family protein [Rhizomicrobium sp.]
MNGHEPGELRALAWVASAIFAITAYCDFAGVAFSSAPRVLSREPILRPTLHAAATLRPAAPVATRKPAPETDARLYWLSRTYRPGDTRLVDVVGAGDVMMGSRDVGLDSRLRPDTEAAALIGGNLAGVFRRADISFANLEGALYDGDDPPSKSCDHCYTFRSPTYYAKYLAQLGIKAVSLANNHSSDYGEDGLRSTMTALQENGIGYCGLDRDGARIAEFTLANGVRAALVSFAPNTGTLDINDEDGEARIIRGLKTNFAVVVVSFHGGGEGEDYSHVSGAREYFHGEDRGNVATFAHAAIEAGADIVIGQGPHVPRALEIWHGHLIAYSLGNFWTYGAIDSSGIRGEGPVLETWLAPDGSVAGFTIHSTEQRGDGVPHLDPSHDAEREMMNLTRSDFAETASLVASTNE